MDNIQKLQSIINHSTNIVFFGGAGISTESGIPDFRSTDGLYNHNYQYPPEEILSHTFFMKHTKEFYDFYRNKILIDGIEPNAAHRKLAELEAIGRLKSIITQNIDGLHQKAGSHNVLELHGSILHNTCMRCKTSYDLPTIINVAGVPKCVCGGIIKPEVVLYEESLDQNVIELSVYAITHADTLIIGGTSLSVYPAAGLVRYFSGAHLVVINHDIIDIDKYADLVIHDGIAKTLKQIKVK